MDRPLTAQGRREEPPNARVSSGSTGGHVLSVTSTADHPLAVHTCVAECADALGGAWPWPCAQEGREAVRAQRSPRFPVISSDPAGEVRV